EKTPFYATVGQLYAPFGRYSSAMVTPTLPMLMFRTKTRPFIFGYKSQTDTGPFAAIYAFKSDTTLGHSGVGGLNAGYIFNLNKAIGEVGAGFISSVNDAAGMQFNDSVPYTTFGGFGSATNGNEAVAKKPAIDLHGNVSYDRFSLTAEWASMTESFRVEDLSYNGRSAKPQAGQIEAGVTFRSFDKPASISAGYQYSRQALALNLPEQSINAVYNISIWKDTVESLEYRHDIGYGSNTYANGAAPVDVVNQNTVGTGRNADTVLAQIGIFF
ncbi:MAG: LbtU family siderophore porin, partial [Legionellaceae bacterium]|nr:LbtU family siderophore porin [Legionellaceae bacterium]